MSDRTKKTGSRRENLAFLHQEYAAERQKMVERVGNLVFSDENLEVLAREFPVDHYLHQNERMADWMAGELGYLVRLRATPGSYIWRIFDGLDYHKTLCDRQGFEPDCVLVRAAVAIFYARLSEDEQREILGGWKPWPMRKDLARAVVMFGDRGRNTTYVEAKTLPLVGYPEEVMRVIVWEGATQAEVCEALAAALRVALNQWDDAMQLEPDRDYMHCAGGNRLMGLLRDVNEIRLLANEKRREIQPQSPGTPREQTQGNRDTVATAVA